MGRVSNGDTAFNRNQGCVSRAEATWSVRCGSTQPFATAFASKSRSLHPVESAGRQVRSERPRLPQMQAA